MSFAQPPTAPVPRALFRAPIWIYRLGLGGLLGHRFVLLTHRGRSTGRARQAVLEVVGRNDATGAVLVASGYGGRSQWFRNILQQPRVLYQLRNRRFRGTARPLPPEESGKVLAHFAQRHPWAAQTLLQELGHTVNGSPESFERVGADTDNGIPVVQLEPERSPGQRFTEFFAS